MLGGSSGSFGAAVREGSGEWDTFLLLFEGLLPDSQCSGSVSNLWSVALKLWDASIYMIYLATDLWTAQRTHVPNRRDPQEVNHLLRRGRYSNRDMGDQRERRQGSSEASSLCPQERTQAEESWTRGRPNRKGLQRFSFMNCVFSIVSLGFAGFLLVAFSYLGVRC